jgi:Zn-dependent protease with chaperone function
VRLIWRGNYFDGVSAKRHRVEAALTPAGIRITREDGGEVFWPYEETTQTQGFFRGAPVRLERGADPGQALVIPDVEFLKALVRASPPGLGSKFHDPETRRLRFLWITLGAAGAIALAAFIYLRGIPAAANAAAAVVPLRWEEKLGEAVAEDFTDRFEECTEPLARETLEKIVEKLYSAAPANPYTFRVHLIRHPMINAFAAPGGDIIVFSGLIESSEKPEELAGVLAHEMVHVIRKHSLKNIFQSLSTYMLLSLVFGDVSGVTEVVHTLGETRYSRAWEREADLMGTELLIAAGIDPSGMATFFKTLKEKTPEIPGALKYLSTHPLTAERIRAIEEKGKASGLTPAPLLPDVAWAEVAGACAGRPGPPRVRRSPVP